MHERRLRQAPIGPPGSRPCMGEESQQAKVCGAGQYQKRKQALGPRHARGEEGRVLVRDLARSNAERKEENASRPMAHAGRRPTREGERARQRTKGHARAGHRQKRQAW